MNSDPQMCITGWSKRTGIFSTTDLKSTVMSAHVLSHHSFKSLFTIFREEITSLLTLSVPQ